MKRAFVAAAVVAALALAGASRPADSPPAAAFAEVPNPLFGIVHEKKVSRLARVDPTSLRPVGRRLVLAANVNSWAYSPDGRTLVVATAPRHTKADRLQLVDTRTMRVTGRVPLDRFGFVGTIAWLAPERVLALRTMADRFDLLVVDPRGRRLLERRSYEGRILGIARSRSSLVLLVAPPESIGPTMLLAIGPSGSARSVALDEIVGGWKDPDEDAIESGNMLIEHVAPGLALDPERNRAFVVPAGGRVAEVDLATGAVAYRDLVREVSLVGRLRNWLEPRAAAKAISGPARTARWLGNGLIAVCGTDSAAFLDKDGKLQYQTRPSGLELIDTRTWTVRTVDAGISYAARAGELLVASGYAWDSTTQRSSGAGLAAYGFDGGKRFHLLDGKRLWIETIVGKHAYVSVEGQRGYTIVDLSSGTVVATRAGNLPWLLVDGARDS